MSELPEEKLWDAIEDARIAMLTTDGSDGLESRPMSAYLDRDARKLWFITRTDSHKTGEIAEGSAVNVSFADPGDNSYVSVTGTARMVRDPAKAKELWNPFAEAWMPEGPEAPTTGLIEVTPTHATLWDSPSKVVQLFQVAVANVTKKPPSGGEVTHVTL